MKTRLNLSVAMSSAIRRHKPPTNAQTLPSTTATGAGRRRQTASTEKGATSPIITTPAQNSGAMFPLISDWAEVPAGPSEAKQLARKPAKTSASTTTKTISSGSSALVASCMPGEAKRKNAVTMSAASPHANAEATKSTGPILCEERGAKDTWRERCQNTPPRTMPFPWPPNCRQTRTHAEQPSLEQARIHSHPLRRQQVTPGPMRASPSRKIPE